MPLYILYLLYMRDRGGSSFRREQLAPKESSLSLSIFLASYLYPGEAHVGASVLKPNGGRFSRAQQMPTDRDDAHIHYLSLKGVRVGVGYKHESGGLLMLLLRGLPTMPSSPRQ
jgi:hypothetical protein